MGKKYTIRWTQNASNTYLDIISYLFDNWSIKEVEQFELDVKKLLNRLLKNTQLCPESKKVNLRKCVITPQTSLIYQLNEKTIDLITFIDNRSNHSY